MCRLTLHLWLPPCVVLLKKCLIGINRLLDAPHVAHRSVRPVVLLNLRSSRLRVSGLHVSEVMSSFPEPWTICLNSSHTLLVPRMHKLLLAPLSRAQEPCASHRLSARVPRPTPMNLLEDHRGACFLLALFLQIRLWFPLMSPRRRSCPLEVRSCRRARATPAGASTDHAVRGCSHILS